MTTKSDLHRGHNYHANGYTIEIYRSGRLALTVLSLAAALSAPLPSMTKPSMTRISPASNSKLCQQHHLNASPMQRPLMRIPYTGPLPPPNIIPRNANTVTGAIAALSKFLTAPPSPSLHDGGGGDPSSTVILSGAGISVASGLADYRGANGTYRQNKTYRPIYYHEFLANHEARKRYWARSFLGWTNLHKAKPNPAHYAVKNLGDMGIVRSVVTQNVDSFHSIAHPNIPTLELHGHLRALTCVSCHNDQPRAEFQEALARMNPAWAAFLEEAIASGALNTENLDEKRAKGLKTNPDGDVDLPGAP